ncbi:carbohydrate esterase family 9 protein [Lentinula aciculospora]|uniref:Carbohydrate esterase family 9 protein n=1 Tax=Lentinula aciculospora TaxID=153920 RepID=A0A9W9DKA5_9AGAR|nr:carbohydrate esterase family 9 protein [Lentinula aciculospora]
MQQSGLEFYNGTEVVRGDILLDRGIILDIGSPRFKFTIPKRWVWDARGRWLTPRIVDLHSHMGDSSSPELSGSDDGNSFKGIAQPWLRSVDGLNTHDDSYQLSIAGGLTTALILPGSANAIGGQAYVIKLRKTAERSTSSMILEPPYQMNSSSSPDPSSSPRWRHIKHACGENPSRVYDGTRMDTLWAFRKSYKEAAKLKQRQDEFCSKAEAGQFVEELGEFPDDLQWEALVDVLRSRVKVNTHCYEAVDLDAFVRLSNEFKFPVAAFHHAHETYLVPEVLKRTYGGPPVSAIFSGFSRYKRESYRFSEFAAKILTENGLIVVMKAWDILHVVQSDHAAINSRYLLHEAQQAYYHGLPENVAIASVTSNPAEAMGMGHRIGYMKKGMDVCYLFKLCTPLLKKYVRRLGRSHPLALGATPIQVFIDGIAQLENPVVAEKPDELQRAPKVSNFDEEARNAVKYDGLPPLTATESSSGFVVFINIKDVLFKSLTSVVGDFVAHTEDDLGVLVARNGKPVCWGSRETCLPIVGTKDSDITVVDLQGGSISPALLFYGSPLGLQHITLEPSTTDGVIHDPLSSDAPSILGNSTLIRAADGLQYGSRDALMAYRSGVTTAITAPEHNQFFFGLGTCFSTGASHKLEPNALPQEITALHTAITYNAASSVSTQISVLRRLLLEANGAFSKVASGQMTLVVEVGNADAIATLISLKKEIEAVHGNVIHLTIAGAAESHLLAKELAEANVGVIVGPIHPFPDSWEIRRILPGPPLSKETTISKLLDYNITVGISPVGLSKFVPPGNWNAQNLRLYAAWIVLDSNGRISTEKALSMASINLEMLLGVSTEAKNIDLVATIGGNLLDESSKVVAILSPRSKTVDIF